MGGVILVFDTTHTNHCNGSILVEWIIAISIVISLVAMGISSIVTMPSRHELNRSTEEVVLAIKKAQLWSMLGHRDDRMAQGEFILKKHSYSIQEGLMLHHVEMELPQHIESAHTMKRVYFSAYGLPYDGTEFILQDTQTGATNRIWISVQTGRVRWEIL
jgi:hypothetical protein